MGVEQLFVIRKRRARIGADRFRGLKIHENQWNSRQRKTERKQKSKAKTPHVKPTCGAPKFVPEFCVRATRLLTPRNQEPDRHPQTARQRLTSARPEPNPTAKGKTLRTPRQTRQPAPALTRSRIARPGRPGSSTAGTLLGDRDPRYCFFVVAGIGICKWTFPVFGSTVSVCSLGFSWADCFGFSEKRKFRSTS